MRPRIESPPREASRLLRLIVRTRSPAATCGWLEIGGRRFPCALGRSGRRTRKREGDGATPSGRWRLLAVLYRPDKAPRPRTALPVQIIRTADGWCDAKADRNYNRRVRQPYPASAEQLWREDHLYDVVVVLGYNVRPRARGLGSAIFLHLAHPDRRPTAGCVALSRSHLRMILALISRQAQLIVPG